MKIPINSTEKILSVIPSFTDHAVRLVTVHIGDYENKTFRTVYLTPSQCTPELRAMFMTGLHCVSEMINAVPVKGTRKQAVIVVDPDTTVEIEAAFSDYASQFTYRNHPAVPSNFLLSYSWFVAGYKIAKNIGKTQ